MKPLIIANWKMNPCTLAEAKQLFNSVKTGIKNIKGAEVVICPPFIYLSTLISRSSILKIGAQDCFWEKRGAFTGEISAFMLKNLGCRYIIIGHSEQRNLFGETNESINKKIKAAITMNLNPVLCVGENLEERRQGRTKNILKKQIISAFKGIPASRFKASKIVIAYEPIWAIGSGSPCAIEEAQIMRILLQKLIVQKYSRLVSPYVQILYGGSVDSKNAKDYIRKAGFQGVLVGGASLNPKEFIKIIGTISK